MIQKRKILIVEDEYILYEQLAEFCEEIGFQVLGLPDSAPVDNYEDAVSLVKKVRPDLAILDIGIKGEKDGIELGTYLRQQHLIPVVYISGRNNAENRERIKQSGSTSLVIKIGKPLNKEQLAANVDFALAATQPKPAAIKKPNGNFFNGKKVMIDDAVRGKRVVPKYENDDRDIETFIKWQDVLFIESHNKKSAGSGNNNLLMHFIDNKEGLLIRGSLTDIQAQLPPYFARFDQSTIVNLKKVTSRNNTKTVYYIGDLFFKISDAFKKAANAQIDTFLGEEEGGLSG